MVFLRLSSACPLEIGTPSLRNTSTRRTRSLDLGSRVGTGPRLYFVRRCSCCLIEDVEFEYAIAGGNGTKLDFQRSGVEGRVDPRRGWRILGKWTVLITLFGTLLYRSRASFILVEPISSKVLPQAPAAISCVPNDSKHNDDNHSLVL